MPKFHNKKTRIDNIIFDSQAEARHYLHLKSLMVAGVVTQIECHPKYELQPAYWKCCGVVHTYVPRKYTCPLCGKPVQKVRAITYAADFRVTYRDGHQEIIDVKGVETPQFKDKKKTFEFRYPGYNLIVVKGAKA
jgi:hypothetical protein